MSAHQRPPAAEPALTARLQDGDRRARRDRRAGANGGRRAEDRATARPTFPVVFAAQLIAQLEPDVETLPACPYPRPAAKRAGVVTDTRS